MDAKLWLKVKRTLQTRTFKIALKYSFSHSIVYNTASLKLFVTISVKERQVKVDKLWIIQISGLFRFPFLFISHFYLVLIVDNVYESGAPNVNSRKISVRKTI